MGCEFFVEAIRLYERRPDTEWSLADRASFVECHGGAQTGCRRSPGEVTLLPGY